ncbi:putative Radical SAM domain protein [uncultured Desulfobacterium sp.]|uniref:Putative Radical SAM domain protein n=1 Tax=uncultured Desulfobacterium sp. TaxID=201089 RepID=A0A445MWK5_9BACT|nr:putative Radical SAM domain protein [uncultured Desulfobacterium sp.]
MTGSMNWLQNSNSRKQALLISPCERKRSLSNDALLPFPSLALPLLASYFPENYTVRIKDERVSKVLGSEKTDIVFITSLTSTAPRAYAIADMFLARGIPVIMGGVHSTVLPQEASMHATSVVTGEAEHIIPRILADFENQSLAPLYQGDILTDLDSLPSPSLDLLDWRHRFFLSPLQTSRGCPRDCDFCSVPRISGRKIRIKSPRSVERELEFLSRFRSRRLFIVDDNFTMKKDRSLDLMGLFRRFGFRWMAFSNLSVCEDEAYLKALADSGCVSLFIGFETLHDPRHMTKNLSFGAPEKMARAIRLIHKYGIGIQGSFIFGFDSDTPEVFRETVAFIQETGIELPNICILTPFPGTPLFDELETENRIIHKDWSYYDMNHVVFRPAGMTQEELQQGYAWALKYLASPSSILSRIKKKSAARKYFLTANFSLHRAQTRLAHSLWNPDIQTQMPEQTQCLS